MQVNRQCNETQSNVTIQAAVLTLLVFYVGETNSVVELISIHGKSSLASVWLTAHKNGHFGSIGCVIGISYSASMRSGLSAFL